MEEEEEPDNSKRRTGRILAAIATGVFLFSVTAGPALAQVDLGMGYAGGIGLPDTDIRQLVGSLVRALLGFVGFIFVLQLIAAGFRYMTHGGDEEARGGAVASIKNAAIGLFLVIASSSIARFVVDAIINATTDSFS